MSLFHELKRRNVFRVAVAYVVASWLIVQASSLLVEIFDAPITIVRVIVVLLVLGFTIAIIFTWAFEVTPEGIMREAEVEHTQAAAQQTARRLDLLTIGLVVIALGFVVFDRLARKEPGNTPVEAGVTDDSSDNLALLTQQLLELERLRNAGSFDAAYELATAIQSLLPDAAARDAVWIGISWQTDIESEPPGAQVLRQPMEAAEEDWEVLGTTPLTGIRFAMEKGYRLKFELAGYRSVEVLQTAVRQYRWGEKTVNPIPIRLDPLDTLPAEMVRIPGFADDLVEFADFFMDRYEVTNREFARFVDGGGYESPDFWQEPLLKDNAEISWNDAMREFVDRTGRPGPATWAGGAYPDGQAAYPVNGVSWFEAAAYAAFVQKQLPTIAHLRAVRKYDNLDAFLVLPRSNLSRDGPRPVGENRAMNTFGIFDLAGNVREWCWNETGNGSRGTNGAAWTDARFHVSWTIPKSSWDRDPTNGFRLIRTFDSTEKLARLRKPEIPPQRRDLRNEDAPSPAEFEIYRRMYSYDRLPLNAETVGIDKFEHWRREHIEFDLPYGERGGAYLYVPAHAQPPFKAVIYWGGSNVLVSRSIDMEFIDGFNFIIRSGRVVAQPILKGTFDRIDDSTRQAMDRMWEEGDDEARTTYRDYQIKWVQDVSRTIDYLQTREDIDSDSNGFYGLSWGAGLAPILLAVEDRIGPAVLTVGGLNDTWRRLPEADPLTFVRAVRNPVLMLNGEYDIVRPMETSQKPMFDLLGTDPADKKHFVVPSGHFVPRDATIRETLDWFDRYKN